MRISTFVLIVGSALIASGCLMLYPLLKLEHIESFAQLETLCRGLALQIIGTIFFSDYLILSIIEMKHKQK